MNTAHSLISSQLAHTHTFTHILLVGATPGRPTLVLCSEAEDHTDGPVLGQKDPQGLLFSSGGMCNPVVFAYDSHCRLGCGPTYTTHCWCWCLPVALGWFGRSWCSEFGSSCEFIRITSLQRLPDFGRLSHAMPSLVCCFLVSISPSTYRCAYRGRSHKFIWIHIKRAFIAGVALWLSC